MERSSATALSPSELSRRLDRVLAAAEKLIAEVPDEHLGRAVPQGDAAIRDLAFGLFRRSLAFADGMDLGRVSPDWLAERTPDALTDGPAIARFGALVRGRLAGWFEGAGPGEYARIIEGSAGRQSGRDLLACTTRDAAHCLRRLHALLAGLGAPPREPLPQADLEGLLSPADLR